MTDFVDYIPTLTRGDTDPPLTLTIGDSRADADFTGLGPSDMIVHVEQKNLVLVEGNATLVEPSQDGKSCVVQRQWQDGETDTVGRCWVSVYVVPWDQTFPDDGPLRLDIARAPGDA